MKIHSNSTNHFVDTVHVGYIAFHMAQIDHCTILPVFKRLASLPSSPSSTFSQVLLGILLRLFFHILFKIIKLRIFSLEPNDQLLTLQVLDVLLTPILHILINELTTELPVPALPELFANSLKPFSGRCASLSSELNLAMRSCMTTGSELLVAALIAVDPF